MNATIGDVPANGAPKKAMTEQPVGAVGQPAGIVMLTETAVALDAVLLKNVCAPRGRQTKNGMSQRSFMITN